MWEIYAYQNADSLFGIFNAIAAIFGSGDYMGTVAAVAFFGFVAAMIAYAFAPEKLQGWKWLGTVVLARALAGPLGGVSRLDWRAEGLVCDLELPGQVLEAAPA